MKTYNQFIIMLLFLFLPLILRAQQNTITVNDRTLNTEMSVGTIAGNAGVGYSGAANYDIKITLPPGIKGVQPSISLTYNSQGGNGVAGWGFNIAGLSVVGRMPKTIYSDGNAKGIISTKDAKYALDGVPLILFSGVSGENGAEYRMETENFSKIYSRGEYNSSSPEQFEVKSKDGVLYKYGSTSGKLIATSETNSQYIHSWYINRVENPDGISIDYEYETSGVGLYIKKISYAANTVEFLYNTRTDKIPVYLGSKIGFHDRILQKIVVKCENNVYRTYDLEYSLDRFSRLIRITESNSKGEKKNPTVFEWGNFPANSNISVKDVNFNALPLEPDFSKQFYSSVDLNGDGLTDIISYFPYVRKDGNNQNYTQSNYVGIQRYFAKKDGDHIKFEGESGFFFTNNNLIPGPIDCDLVQRKYGGFIIGDYYGRGIQNAILPVFNKEGNIYYIRFYIYNDYLANYIEQNLVCSSETPEIAIGDIDNDGKSELLYIEKGKAANGSYVLKVGGHNKSFVSYNLSIKSNPEKMLIADFNGDGMNDVLVVTKDGYHIYWNRGGYLANSFSSSSLYFSSGTIFNDNYTRIEIGDFNGDGLPDLVLSEQTYDRWYLAINQGNGNFSKKVLPQIKAFDENFTVGNDDKDFCFVTDFDGDGKSDIIINDSDFTRDYDWLGNYSGGKFINHKVYWYRSTGDDFELVKSTTYNKGDAFSRLFTFGDYKGIGSTQMLFFGYDCYNGDNTKKWRLYEKAGLTAESGKIIGISDGLNNKTYFNYKPLTDTSIYTAAANLTYPLAPLALPLYAVAEMRQSNGVIPDNIVNKYTYRNGKIHLSGRGFLGFEQVARTESLSKTTQIQEYGINNIYYFPFSKKTTMLIDKDTISTATCSNKVISLYDKRIFQYTDSIIEKDHLNGISNSRISVYNSDGNLIKETMTYGNDVTEVNDNMTYQHFGGNGIANKLTSVAMTRTYSGKPSYEHRQKFDYNSKGVLIRETSYDNTTDPVITEYLNINTYGLPDKMKVSTKENVRETSFSYDHRCRLTAVTNAIGQYTRVSYDNFWQIDKQSSHLNLNTTNEYDGWNRKTLIKHPDNTSASILLTWANGSDAPSDSRYCLTSTSTGKPAVITYYDAIGRELRTVSYDAFNRKVYSDVTYNKKGQIEKTSLPYFSNESPKWIIYTYRNDGRLDNENNLGITTKYEYGKLTSTIIGPDGNKSTKTMNAKGDILKIEEPGREGLIQYTYNSFGQPSQINANGSIYSMDYDSYGRQKQLTDPNAGVIKFNYNPLGELLSQEDANKNITIFKYDIIGRKKERIVNGKTYTSIYNNYGIDYVEYEDMTLSYKYDSYGRVQSLTEKAGSNSYTASYSYDANGQLRTCTYPSGLTIQYSYTNGVLAAIHKLPAQEAIWELKAANSLGQITAYQKGGKYNVDLEYDAYFNLNNKKLNGNSYAARSVNPLTGNINSRSYGARSESFEYDHQNRLTKWSDNSMTYYDNGNIKTKKDVGTYIYGSSRPHALTGVTENIASANQDIAYNDAGRAGSIEEDKYSVKIDYGIDNQRIKTRLYENGTLIKEKHYASDYEKVITGQSVRELHYIGAPSGITAIIKRSNGVDSLFHIYTDHQGSIMQITNDAGNEVERRSYDPWGRERNPDNWLNFNVETKNRLTDRGYTGHEHLPEFGLINMNARLYDPILGRFLSPDPYVQSPNFSQSFNRYAYCFNNPLIYTDPSGEWNWLVAAFGTLYGYVSHGLIKDNWGWEAAGNGLLTGLMWGVGYTSGVAESGITPLSYAAQSAVSSTVNSFAPSMSIPISDNFSINTSFGLGISPDGLVGGMSFSGTFHHDKFALTGGIGESSNMSSWGGGISYDDIGVSYYRTTFGNAKGPDGKSNAQTVGGYGINIKDFSFRLENDLNFKIKGVTLGGDGGDRWRTSAVEIGIGKFVIGSYVYTNESDGNTDNGHSRFWKKGKEAYADSRVFSSPLYIGVKQGGRVTRIGLNQPWIQDMTQNGVHLFLSKSSPLFHTPYKGHNDYYSSTYLYSGYYNPYSLFYR